MQELCCHACGCDGPSSWEDVVLVEGRRVIECGSCGARYPWRLLARPRMARHHLPPAHAQ